MSRGVETDVTLINVEIVNEDEGRERSTGREGVGVGSTVKDEKVGEFVEKGSCLETLVSDIRRLSKEVEGVGVIERDRESSVDKTERCKELGTVIRKVESGECVVRDNIVDEYREVCETEVEVNGMGSVVLSMGIEGDVECDVEKCESVKDVEGVKGILRE